MVRFLTVVFLFALLAGCASTARQQASSTDHPSPPAWVLQPEGPQGQLGGVGVSRPHIRGRSFQRQTAVSRAIDEIARQLGVRVDSILSDQQKSVDGGSLKGQTAIYSFQTTTGEVISARLRALYIDPASRELFAWMTIEP